VIGAPMTIHEVADLAARSRAIHLTVFTVAGEWARITPGPDRRWLARTSHEHAWHADLWASRFPVVPGLDLADATAAASSALASTTASLDATDRPGRRAAISAVIESLAAELGATRARVDGDLDAPTARVLDLVMADLGRQLVG
jgi:hypothetical protein